ncbi:MAG: hypothetical protein N2490_06275 [Ignavibacteria bacterium]|nr:hypothetical protein [Ignavibacteria bacterium]
MSRFIKDYETNKTPEVLENIINEFFKKEGFKNYIIKNEEVWKKGMGLLMGPQIMKVKINGSKVHLEAWVKFALLPGIYVGEMGTTGVIGALPKKLLKDKILLFEKVILQ